MDSDLAELNRRLAKRIGLEEGLMAGYSGFLSVCVARLKLEAAALQDLALKTTGVANPLDVIYINRDYLNHARMEALNVVGAGQFYRLLVLGINIEQARVLARLNNHQITQIAKYADGEVFQSIASIWKLDRFQSSARPQFAAALIAA